uniref:Uncharacterized protein n=1 Tax=Alexandrium catenella TaxID=2925 RepID=A0A7S1S5K5_ALECA
MGAKIAFQVHHEVDSPSNPGQKCCLTDSLDKFTTFDGLFDEILENIKDPLLPTENWLVKEVVITDEGPEEFAVKVIHDARKLATFGWGKEDGSDRVRSWVKVRHNRAKREIITEEYWEDGRMEIRCFTKFLSDPLRVEFWGEHCSGERRCGQIYARIVKYQFLMPSLKKLVCRKVPVKLGTPSIDDRGGTSVISEALDDYTSYIGLMNLLQEALKSPAEKANLPVTEINDHEFELKTPGPPKKFPAPGEEIERDILTWLYKFDADNGQINAVVSVGNELLHTSWIRVHRDPLRLEHWIEQGGKRLAGRCETFMLQEIIDSIVRKAEGLDGWFF